MDSSRVRLSIPRLAVVLCACAGTLVTTVANARMGDPPLSATADLRPLEQVGVLTLEPIDSGQLLAEDEAAKKVGPAQPLRFALPADMTLTPADSGSWETLADGGRVWRLRIFAPGATDLNFGFTRFALADSATLHIWSEGSSYFQGPYTAADASHAGDFWTPVVPGDRAVIELYEPPAASSELILGRVGRGYRDLFGRKDTISKQGSCNIDVVCPEGGPWRDEIRSVALLMIGGSGLCTGTLIMDVPGSFTPYVLSANHCGVTSANSSSVVAYWNFESATCGDLCCGTMADNQSGAIFRASRADNDFVLMELEEDPDPFSNVFFSGFDARTSTAPQSSVGIHQPNGDEKAITFNNDPLRTDDSCVGAGIDTHWWIDQYELGTTEPGSSGSGLWDPATHLVIGYLSGGTASCSLTSGYDCYGKMSVGWDGSSDSTRLKDWLDPQSTGTRFVAGSDPSGVASIRYASHTASDSCASGQGHDNGVWEPGETIQIAVELRASQSFTNVTGTLTSLTAGVTVIDGTASWPNLPPAVATSSSAPHFTIKIGDGVACGTTVQLQVQVQGSEGGPFTFTISGGVGASLQPQVPVTIPDNGSATSTLLVGETVTLSDVNVKVKINHTYVGDLIVKLRGPSGTEVTLLDRPACGDNDLDIEFDDSATTTLASYCAGNTPWYQGTARPTQPLSAFNGQSSAGTWSLVVSDNAGADTGSIADWELVTTPSLSGTCLECTGGGGSAYTYLVAGVSHTSGAQNTNWRTKLSLLNRSGALALVTISYVYSGQVKSVERSLNNNQLSSWDDVAVTLFGLTGLTSGAVVVSSTQPLVVTARNYNLVAPATYGGFMPGVLESDALSPDETGVISMLIKNADYRTNVGFVNLGANLCTVRVTLRDTVGNQIGNPRTLDVPASGWFQDNNIFPAAGAGARDDAYATVEVLTGGCQVWGYGAVVDEHSGDLTTVPMVIP